MIINLQTFIDQFKKHVSCSNSSQFLCSQPASFESWFRVEFFSILCHIGFQPNHIFPSYSYQSHQGEKADLFVNDCHHKIIFELKSFVRNQDAKKRKDFPKQINRLLDELNGGYVDQVIVFATFIGYGRQAMNNWASTLRNWLGNQTLWHQIGPQKILQQYELQFWMASKS